jgi:hypothetical protein
MTITSVVKKPSGLWIVTDDAGVRYATRSDFQAALAERYRELGTEVRLHSNKGWFYRELHEITPVAKDHIGEVA